MVRFGKHPPKVDYRTLQLRNYLMSNLAPPPSAVDTLASVYDKLGLSDPGILFPMDGNDKLGDCTIAAVAHATTVFRGLIGKQAITPDATVVKTYYHLTGGVDTGLNELDVLNYWQSTKIGREQIMAFAKIDPKNHTHVQQAIQLFGGVYIGFQVQQDCVQQFDAHQPWTPGPLTNDGHAVFVTGYDQAGVTVLTWGSTQKGVWAWWDECVDEAYALLAPETKTFAGFNLAQLKADLADITV